MYTWQGLILALVAPVSLVMGLLCVPVDGNMCSAFTASDRHGQPTVLRDKLIKTFKTTCRPTKQSVRAKCRYNGPVIRYMLLCSFNTDGYLGPIRYTVLKDAFKMPFSVNFSVKAGDGAKVALSENGTDDSIFTAICIGCGWDVKTFVRARHPYTCSERLETYVDQYIIDPYEYRSFWIEYEMGIVRVGKGGVTDAILEWNAGAYHGRVPTQAYVGVSTGSYDGEWTFC